MLAVAWCRYWTPEPLSLPVRTSQSPAASSRPRGGSASPPPCAAAPVPHPAHPGRRPRTPRRRAPRRRPGRQPPAGLDSASLAAARAAEADSLARIVNAIDADEWRTLAAPLVEPVLHRATEDPDAPRRPRHRLPRPRHQRPHRSPGPHPVRRRPLGTHVRKSRLTPAAKMSGPPRNRARRAPTLVASRRRPRSTRGMRHRSRSGPFPDRLLRHLQFTGSRRRDRATRRGESPTTGSARAPRPCGSWHGPCNRKGRGRPNRFDARERGMSPRRTQGGCP